MECPACGKLLVNWNIGDIEVDVCDGGCGGIWFDIFELQKVDERHEALGEKLLTIPADAALTIDHTSPRACPKCLEVIMMRHFYSPRHEVEIDECGGCGGFWLDAGELAHIRNLFDSAEQQQQAAEAFMADIRSELDTMAEKSAEKADQAARMGRIFRFICPSFYLPGKQPGAAY